MAAKTKFQMPGQYEYEGMLLSNDHTVDVINRVVTMDLAPTDMVVASYPKTGTTLLQEIVWLLRNEADVEGAKRSANIFRVPYIDLNISDGYAMFQALPHPRTMKTHVIFKLLPKGVLEGRNQVICSLRNPKDVIVSFYHFYRMNNGLGPFTGSWDEFFDYFMDTGGKLLYGNPLDHMLSYWQHRNDENVLNVFYEDMVTKPYDAVKQIAEFMGVSMTDQKLNMVTEATSFETMKNNPMTNYDYRTIMNLKPGDYVAVDNEVSPFMRKGKIGDWKNYFSKEQNLYMDDMIKRKLAGTGLDFVYE